MKSEEITVLDQDIHINKDDYFSLTDIARYKKSEAPADVVKNWLRRKDTIEFIGVWERLNNPDFNVVEFDQFKNEAGYNCFALSPKKWIEGAIPLDWFQKRENITLFLPKQTHNKRK